MPHCIVRRGEHDDRLRQDEKADISWSAAEALGHLEEADHPLHVSLSDRFWNRDTRAGGVRDLLVS